MISFKSHKSDGSSYQVFDDGVLIGHILRQTTSLDGDKFIAMINVEGKEMFSDESFVSPDDALKWIEEQRQAL